MSSSRRDIVSNSHRVPNSSNIDIETSVSVKSTRVPCSFIIILSLECVLNFATFAFSGLALKWDLTVGTEVPHEHPHIHEESYIQRPNNLLSIIMISTSLNFLESLLLLVFYARSKWRGDNPPRFRRFYATTRAVFFFYSWLCIILSGMSLAACWAIQMELYPPDLRCMPTLASMTNHPPAAPPPPPPVSPILPRHEVYLLYALCGLLSLLKFFNYANGIPYAIYKWSIPVVYA